MSMWSRLLNVFRGERLNRDLEEEMQAHVDEAIASGRDPAEARRAFGPMLLQREHGRDVRLLPWVDSLRSDVIFGWRQLLKNKVVTGAAILSLALAIGACTAAFRLVDALLLRPLPVASPEHLYTAVYLYPDKASASMETGDSWEYPLFRRLREALKDDAELMAISYATRTDLTFSTDQYIEKAYRQWVDGRMFSSFGLKPALGRLLLPSDDMKPGAHPYAVLSYEYWQRRFGGEANVIGKSFVVGNQSFEIVGVVEKNFHGTETGTRTDFYVPTMMNARAIDSPGWSWFRLWARVRPGVQTEPLEQKLRAEFRSYHEQAATARAKAVPDARKESDTDLPVAFEKADAGISAMQRDYRRPLWILGGLVGLVLLIACTNVANLMTAQAAARSREMALRVSIGAGRWRLIQLVLVESAMVAAISSVLGVLFSIWAAPFVVGRISSPENEAYLTLATDGRMVAFGLFLTLAITVLFGLAPALRASGVTPAVTLKGGEDPRFRRRLTNGLIAAQVAFCFLVHFVSGLFVATHDRLSSQPLGFVPKGVLAIDIRSRQDRPIAQWNELMEHLRQVRGVEAASFSGWPLMGRNSWGQEIWVDGNSRDGLNPYFLNVSPGWLESMRIVLLEGRDFRPEEAQPDAAIANEAFARKYFDGRSPVGKSFEMEINNQRVRIPIVGYMKDSRYRGMRESIRPTVYVPFSSRDEKGTLRKRNFGALLIRVSGENPLDMVPVLRQEIRNMQKDLLVTNIQTQMELVEAQTIRERLLAMLSLFFAAVSLALACVGLYGVLNYSVVQRRREIGIRLALGAKAGDVARRVTTEIFAMLLLGSVTGLVLGIASERYLAKLLFGVRATDWPMLAAPVITILVAAIAAAIPPVIRAVRINPAVTLRSE